MPDSILTGLNPEQREAVTWREGPLLIIAGAGTGKTTVITRRIAWLIDQGLAKMDEILALTFTDKAAHEMQERVDILLPYGYTDVAISTFHAFGDRLLRENALVAGLNPDFRILTQPEAAVFLREHLFEFGLSYYRPLSDPTKFIGALIQFFSRCRDEDIAPDEYLRYAKTLAAQAASSDDAALREEASQQQELAAAYRHYQELMMKEGVVDFASLFYLALELLRSHPAVVQRYRRRYKYILVDEFQDTNVAQFAMVKLLAGNGNLTVVADDDQCIYRWRGAAYSNVLNFIEEYPAARQVSLIRNFRSTQPILDAAYRLIQNNNPERFEVKAKIDKRLIGVSKEGAAPEHFFCDTVSTEADTVAGMIRDKVKSGGYRYRDFAILVRANNDAEPFLQALNMLEVPWQFSGNQGLYSRKEVKLCINFLRAAADPSDSMSLYYLAGSELYAINPADLARCAHYARRRNRPLYRVFQELAGLDELQDVGEESRVRIARLRADLEKFLEVARDQTTGRLLYAFLTDTGYLKGLTHDPDAEKEEKIQNLAKFFGLVRDFERVAREDRVMSFVRYLNLMIEAGDDPATAEADVEADAVNVLTVHKAKGLEFRVVFMVSLVQGKFPWPRRSHQVDLPDALIKEALPEGDFHIQEERRLFYVAMTRAKEGLYLTGASDYGGVRMRKVSQFVVETLGEETRRKEKKKASALEAISRFAPAPQAAPSAPDRAQERPVTLSYYQIDDYQTCPLKYKYVNILRVPIMEHHTVVYGRAMHEAVSRYFLARLAGAPMTQEELIGVFRASFDPQGFLDERHQRERSRRGEEALARFFNDEQRRTTTPLYIEKDFRFVFEGVIITGRFDRIDRAEDGLVIVDFKTSEIKTQKDADKRARETMQLSLYAMACRDSLREEAVRGELYFLESGMIGSAPVTDKGIAQVQEAIRAVAAGIRGQQFPPHPEYMACTYCAYRQICPYAMTR